MAEKKKKTIKGDKARPTTLGTGGASKAASALVERRKRNCESGGGTWNNAALRCDW